MSRKSGSNFLERRISGLKLQKKATTYNDDLNDDINEVRGGNSRATSLEDGCASLNGDNQLGDNGGGAGVVVAAGELREDRVALAAKGGEGVLDVGGRPLGDDLGDGPSNGHSTGGEDSEDGEETHCDGGA
jgi:hypothetical protein